ncbi:hypothetical protein NZK35_32110 [Stieleria sp. ICT_E10.1]|uniref:hypothetical protein n=1 Tax=Stieleria sedimenti TaxID=2976331 RepID=UPI00217FC088|nr:hypothetical protein [Stieleria sedimenti]MCS7471323.1 hypothetical protein [Stieleria sedimenti]
MKRIAYALLLLACTCPPSHAQEHPIGTPAAKTLAADAVTDDSDAAPQKDSDNELVENANSDRQYPASADANVTLKRLQWLVGNWADDADDGRVEFQFELVGDGGFLKNAFSSSDQDGNVVLSGVQVIGKDPETQSLRSWTFDSQGGRGEAEWTYVDGRWLSRSSFTLVDGSTASAINVYTKIDEDSFEWKSVSREVNGELQPALPPSIVRRVIDSSESVENGASEIPVEGSETDSPEASKACAD